MGLEPASVRMPVSKHFQTCISETSGPIEIEFYLKQHLGGGKATLGFRSDRSRTLVSMATGKSDRIIMGKML